MGLMMMPVMTVSMDTIPPQQISRASALSNVLRQLFGAFSTAIFASILLDRQQHHLANLAEAVTSTNIMAVGVLNAVKTAMLQQGISEAAAQAAGLAALTKQVGLTAAVRSYDDCFVLATFVTLVGLLPSLWLKRGRKSEGQGKAVILD
jgi:hypothetical protein